MREQSGLRGGRNQECRLGTVNGEVPVCSLREDVNRQMDIGIWSFEDCQSWIHKHKSLNLSLKFMRVDKVALEECR